MLPILGKAWQSGKFRFLAIGAFNTGFGYLAFSALYLLLNRHLHYLLIGALAHAVSVVVAFTGQRRLVFRSHAPWLPEFVRFNLSLLAVFLGGLAGLYFLVEQAGTSPLLGQAIVTAVSVVGSYLAHRHFSFRPS